MAKTLVWLAKNAITVVEFYGNTVSSQGFDDKKCLETEKNARFSTCLGQNQRQKSFHGMQSHKSTAWSWKYIDTENFSPWCLWKKPKDDDSTV